MSIFWEVGFANTVFPDSELQVVLFFRSELSETYHHIISFNFKAAVLLKFGRITWWIAINVAKNMYKLEWLKLIKYLHGLDTVSLVPKLIHVTSGPT